MKRLGIGIPRAVAAAALWLAAADAQAQTPAAVTSPGNIPILFNDRHVYAKPTRIERRRVLAALVRGSTVLVPLRSLFERTGAAVTFDPTAKSITVSKPGSVLKLTVGRPEVVVNGESRPLDVPPEISRGSVLVPLRVISEGMGAYVQWVPQRRTVVIRYGAAASPSPSPPALAPSPAPVDTQAPLPEPPSSPAPARKPPAAHEGFVAGDYLFAPKVWNEFSAGNRGVGVSHAERAALEFSLRRLPLMIGAEYRSMRYPHSDDGTGLRGDPGFVTVIGGYGQTDIPAFTAKDVSLSGSIGVKIADPRLYVAVSYVRREENYGYPKQSGLGFGIEKLPDLDRPVSIYGSAYEYPSVSGTFPYPQDIFTCPIVAGASACPPGSLYGTSAKFTDRVFLYRVGLSVVLTGPHALGLFFDGGYLGDTIRGKTLSPGNAAHNGPYAGLGLKL